MSWYSHDFESLNGNDSFSRYKQHDSTPAQALISLVENVNCLISVLRIPSNPSKLREGKLQKDLSDKEQQDISSYLALANEALQKLANEYQVRTGPFQTPSILRSRDAPGIFTPQTRNLVSSFESNAAKQEYPNVDMIKNSKTNEIEPNVDSTCIEIGTVFATLDEAADIFREYALKSGFNICKGNSKKDVYQEYACSARGKVRVRKVADQVKRRNRKSIKKMCKCHIILRRKGANWIITTRRLSHTHQLMNFDEIKKTAKNRYIPDEIRERALEMYKQGEAPAKIQYHFEGELGPECTWSMKDLYNMLYRHREKTENGSSIDNREDDISDEEILLKIEECDSQKLEGNFSCLKQKGVNSKCTRTKSLWNIRTTQTKLLRREFRILAVRPHLWTPQFTPRLLNLRHLSSLYNMN